MSEQPSSASPGTPATPAVWSDRDLSDPHHVADKATRVRAMFSAIAGSYDLNNRVHSLGRDQAWRRAAVKAATVRPGDVVLDVACGTGDLTEAFARTPAGSVLGVDFTFNMLQHAQRKREARQADVAYALGDAQQLPAADGSADVVSIAFGIRNVASPQRAIDEFHRVLKPGGRLVILEFSLPRNPILRWGYNLYFRQVLPRTASLIARDRSGAYRYLPQSVNTFIDRPRLMAMMSDAGFVEVTARPLTFGIAVAYRGVKPVD